MPLLTTVIALSVKGLLLLRCNDVNLHWLWSVLIVLLVPVPALPSTRVGGGILTVAMGGLALFFSSLVQVVVDPDGHYCHFL